MVSSKDVKDLIKALREQGWRVEETGRHPVAYAPDGVTIVTLSSTPSDHRAFRNMVARLRRAGFEWKGR